MTQGTPTELQACAIKQAREDIRAMRAIGLHERSKWRWSIDDLLETLAEHPDWTVTLSGDHRPRPARPLPPSLADRARAYLAGHADESIESILEDMIELVELIDGES